MHACMYGSAYNKKIKIVQDIKYFTKKKKIQKFTYIYTYLYTANVHISRATSSSVSLAVHENVHDGTRG